MDIEKQRSLFEAEDRLANLKKIQDKLLESFRRFFAASVVLLLAGALIPVFFLHSSSVAVNQLVGFATGILVLSALLVLILAFVAWRHRFSKQLSRAEEQLITAQKAFIHPYVKDPTIQQLVELGFPRKIWSRNTKGLGSTLVKSDEGTPMLLELSYDQAEGYKLLIKEPNQSKL